METFDGWIPVSQWLTEMRWNASQVNQRVAKGQWVRGVHYSVPEERQAYVHRQRCLDQLAEAPGKGYKAPPKWVAPQSAEEKST